MIGVFGANGFIGKNLCLKFSENGNDYIAVDYKHDIDFFNNLNASTHIANLLDPSTTKKALEGVKVVIQLIATSGPSWGISRFQEDIANDIGVQVNFLQQCVESGVQKFIFISSGGTVYGPSLYLPIDEVHPTNPINSYGVTKLTVEKYLQIFCQQSDMDFTIVRPSNPYGPHQRFLKGQGLVAAILEKATNNQPINIFGDGTAQRDYIYVEDLVDAIVMCVEKKEAIGKVFNIGSGKPHSILQVVHEVENALQRKLVLNFVDSRSSDVKKNFLSIEKAEKLLRWKPKTSLVEGIRNTVTAS